MPLTPLLALALASVLLLATPARGQSAEEVESLLAQARGKDKEAARRTNRALRRMGAAAVPPLITLLSNEEMEVRRSAAMALVVVAPNAAPAVPALIQSASNSDEDPVVREWAIVALGEIGPQAAPAVPALTAALSEEWPICACAAIVLRKFGVDLKRFWWVVPRAYWKELVGLLLLLLAWFVLLARFPRHRPRSTPKHLALMALTGSIPAGLSCSAVYYGITRDWAQGFLPDAVTVVPFPVAAVLSTALVCMLPAVWVCQRKKLAPEAADDPTPLVEPGPSTAPAP